MDILLINVESAKERLAFQDKQLSALGLPYQRLNAITIDEITPEIINKHYYDWQRPLRKTELACYFSHREAWKTIKNNNRPALILEDDALLSTELPEILEKLSKIENADLVTLEVRSRKKYVGKKPTPLTQKTQLVRLYQDKTGAAAYVLWPKGVDKLMQHEKNKGIALADAFMYSCKKLRLFQIEPAAALQLDQCENYGLNLSDKKNLSKSTVSSKNKISREKIFFCKRFAAQINLGIRNIYLSFKSERRMIKTNSNDFSNF